MDHQTSPTRRSCRQYWNNLPAHRKREILSRGEWTTFTSLINLPPTRRCGEHHHLSDNKGNDEADDADVGEDSVSVDTDDANDADVGEDSVSDDADDANDAGKEDHSYITQPPSDNNDDHDHNDDEDDNEDEDDDNSHNSYNQGDIPIYDSDNHLIIDDFHPYDEDDDHDHIDNEDDNEDEGDDDSYNSYNQGDIANYDSDNHYEGPPNYDSDGNEIISEEDFFSWDEEDDDNKDEDEDDNEDEDEDEDDDLLNSDEIYSASTVSFCDLNHEDDHSSLSSIEKDHSDHSSVSSIDFDHFDFAPILADLELIRQNGYMRNPHSVNSSWRFTKSQICFAVRNYPNSFLREYFVGGTFPNFH